MILFVSGRCDIPAFYSEWFFQRLKEGYVDVRNPYNEHQISRILLNKEMIDCILFCTKDPRKLLLRLDEIPFPYLFHVTLTGYHTDIEPGVKDKKSILEAVKQLSARIGKDRVIIRYDPILLNNRYDAHYHGKAFEALCQKLNGYVDTYILSFVDLYKNTRKHAGQIGLKVLGEQEMYSVAKAISPIITKYKVKVQTCAEEIDLSMYGITKGNCIDREDLHRRLGNQLRLPIGKSVRTQCDCLPSVDIGDYNACPHYCAYCYANYDEDRIRTNIKRHDPNSSLLLGHLCEEDKITIRKDQKKY